MLNLSTDKKFYQFCALVFNLNLFILYKKKIMANFFFLTKSSNIYKVRKNKKSEAWDAKQQTKHYKQKRHYNNNINNTNVHKSKTKSILYANFSIINISHVCKYVTLRVQDAFDMSYRIFTIFAQSFQVVILLEI